jgi:GMP synthase (glutamine-hydrolysing)
MRPLGILVTGDPVEAVGRSRGTFADLFRQALSGVFSGEVRVVDARRGEGFRPSEVSGLVITGSSESVISRAPWIVEAERAVAETVQAGVPTLGVCFGHQLLCQALGGEVVENPNGREMGTVALRIVGDDPLLAGVADPLEVNMSHRDSAVRLPPGARVLASSALDPNALVRFGERAVGMQFHPEFDGEVMRTYIDARRGVLAREGIDPERLRAVDAPLAVELLRRFVSSL